MKNLLIFCLLLVIHSCNTPKQTIVSDKQESFIDSTLVIKDTIQYQQVDTVLKLEYIKSEIIEEIKISKKK